MSACRNYSLTVDINISFNLIVEYSHCKFR